MHLCSVYAVYRAGTSMISLVIPPKDQVSRIVKMLADEYGTASNIKSRVNRSVNISMAVHNFGLVDSPFQKMFSI
jgi:peptide subunit release factor 1 (eRF1)